MTSGIPGRAMPAPGTPPRSAPIARISLSALDLNLRAVIAATPDTVIDVRADGWGHGAEVVARRALRAGASALLVDDRDDPAWSGVDPAAVRTSGPSSSPDAVYGLSTGFTSVMSLWGHVLSLKPLRAGEGVSYGYTHRATDDTVVALVTGGYAQGVVRALGNAAHVWIAGARHPIVGRVAMDVCVVDVGVHTSVQRGDEVLFFGGAESIGLAEWTAATGMAAAELVTAVGLRASKEYVA